MMKIRTVADLIEVLKTFPADTPMRIMDADTGWSLLVRRVYLENDEAFVSGEYHWTTEDQDADEEDES